MSVAPSSRDRPATVYDVAALAGVSAQTVSRFVKGFEGIRPATRERVQAAIEELGYRPNHAARLLRTQKSNRIGALVHDMFERGPGELLRGAAIEARRWGYSLNVVGIDSLDEQSIDDAFDQFEVEQVAGILVVTLTEELREVVRRRSSNIPVLIDPADAPGPTPTTSESGGREAALHLLALGHRRIGLISGPEGRLPSKQRRDSFIQAVDAAGADVVAEWPGDWSPEAGAAAAEAFDPSEGVTGVFAANDAMAIGFIHGLIRRGIEVPGAVSVVGFDDIPVAAYLQPELTTVRPIVNYEGKAAIDALIALIEDRPAASIVHSGTELVARSSTAPAPVG
ncbi:LacI family DNA-binding transcriptional regulator [Microbacterium natoriense]